MFARIGLITRASPQTATAMTTTRTVTTMATTAAAMATMTTTAAATTMLNVIITRTLKGVGESAVGHATASGATRLCCARKPEDAGLLLMHCISLLCMEERRINSFDGFPRLRTCCRESKAILIHQDLRAGRNQDTNPASAAALSQPLPV